MASTLRSSAPSADPVKQLRIKLGVVTRTQKELAAYHKELEDQRAKVARMRGTGADEYDIKKQVEVQGETEVMIPDTMRRLAKGFEDLQVFLDASGGDAALSGNEMLQQARELLAAAGAAGGGGAGGGGGGGGGEEEDDAI
jgi:tubulin-specific chaperone A